MGMHVSPNFTPKSQQLIIDAKIMASSLNHPEGNRKPFAGLPP